MQIDQLLFGYRDGHELLAGSVAVDPRHQHDLLPHVDARFEDDSEHYMVGVWIASLERFMLVRIWPAPELPRPGAVWAHALLLDARAQLEIDPLSLLDVFRRPDVRNLARFDEPVSVESSPLHPSEASHELLQTLCLLAYAPRERKPVVLWQDLSESEEALLAVWRLLPHRARVDFSFRTRGRARAGQSSYSIQVAGAFGGRTASAEVELWDPRQVREEELPQWSRELARASADPADRLAAALGELASTTEEAKSLAALWPLVRDEAAPPTLKELEEAGSLQRAADSLFGEPQDPQFWKISESERIQNLLLQPAPAPVADSLLTQARLRALWDSEHELMVSLFDRRSELRPRADAMLIETAALEMGDDELLVRCADADVLEVIFDQRTELLQIPALWRSLTAGLHEGGLRIAIERASDIVPTKPLVKSLLAAEAWPGLRFLSEDDAALPVIVNRASVELSDDARRWEEIFSERQKSLLHYLAKGERVRPEALVLAAATMTKPELSEISLRRWVIAAREVHDREDWVAVRAAANLLLLTLGRKGESPRKILINTFGPLQAAIEQGRIDPETTSWLNRSLPNGKRRTLAERLDRVVIKSMEATDWSKKDLLRALEHAGPRAKSMVHLVPKKAGWRRKLESALQVD